MRVVSPSVKYLKEKKNFTIHKLKNYFTDLKRILDIITEILRLRILWLIPKQKKLN